VSFSAEITFSFQAKKIMTTYFSWIHHHPLYTYATNYFRIVVPSSGEHAKSLTALL